MGLKALSESIDGIREDALIESAKAKGDSYGDAALFFKSGTQPDGGKWKDRIIPKLGFNNAPVVMKAKKKPTKNGMVYTATLKLAPGKGGGGGVGGSVQPLSPGPAVEDQPVAAARGADLGEGQ